MLRFRTRRTNGGMYHRKMDRCILYPGKEIWHRFGVVDLVAGAWS